MPNDNGIDIFILILILIYILIYTLILILIMIMIIFIFFIAMTIDTIYMIMMETIFITQRIVKQMNLTDLN